MVNNILTVKEENFKNITTVECKLPISFEEADKVLCLSAKSEIASAMAGDGFVTYNGKTIFTLLYYQSEVIKKCEHGVEFSFKVEVKNAKSGDIVRLSTKTIEEKATFANGIISASAKVLALGVLVLKEVTEVNPAVLDNLCKKEETKSYNEIASVQKAVTIEDEFELNYSVKDVLCHDECVTIKNIQVGIGEVTIDGEIEVTAYLNKLDSDDVCKERKSIPFTIEVETDNANPSCMAHVDVCVNTCYLKAFVDEGKNKSDFSIEANLNLLVVCVENVNYSAVVDVYSPANEINASMVDVNLVEFLRSTSSESQINGDINYEITKNDRLIAVVGVKIEGEEYDFVDGTLKASGVVSAVAILNTENGVKKVELTCPYETLLIINGNAHACARVSVRNFEARLTPSGFEYSFIVTATAKDLVYKTIKVVNDVEIVGEKQQNDSAISVFFARKGQTTWDACKALGASYEDLARYNDNMPEVFSGEERIVIFREEK